MCPDCSFTNDVGFNSCRQCGFQTAQLSSQSRKTHRVHINLPAIDRRISSLRLELPNHMRDRSVPCTWSWSLLSSPSTSPVSAPSPRDVVKFLAWKDSKGRPKIHTLNCPNFGYQSKQKCACSVRLAACRVNNNYLIQVSSLFSVKAH